MIIEGVVIEGRKLGRNLGFPTANVAIGQDAVVDNGVYISRVKIADKEYDAVTNIGTNPTVGSVAKRAESYILEFNGDIYGQRIVIELGKKIRSEMRFESIEALRDQIARDVEYALLARIDE